jgi:hypothetical protein
MKKLLACCLLLVLSGAAWAQEDNDNPYYKKYGDEGVKRLLHFDQAIQDKPEALSSDKKEYKMPETVKTKDGETLKSIPTHEACTRGDERSVEGSQTVEIYKLDGHNVKVTIDSCTDRYYDLKTKKLSPPDEGGYTKFKVVVDGKQTLDLYFPGDIVDYTFYKNELITDVIECCNGDNYYNRHDWLAGKEIEKDILHINGDDLPQDMQKEEIDDSAIDSLLDLNNQDSLNAFGIPSVEQQLNNNASTGAGE